MLPNFITSKIFIALVFISNISFAQIISNTTMKLGQEEVEMIFFQQVKNIEEFDERFNDSGAIARGLFPGQFTQFYPGMLVASLFNYSNANLMNDNKTNAFYKDVKNRYSFIKLSAEDTNWYAEAMGSFRQNGKELLVPIIMRIVKSKNNSFKWMIDSVKFRCSDTHSRFKNMQIPARVKQDYIPVSAYATYFACLTNILNKDFTPQIYATEDLLNSNSFKLFSERIISGQLTFDCIYEMKFHFFQIPHWHFIVENFQRRSGNSGWLINGIYRVKGGNTVQGKTQPYAEDATLYDKDIIGIIQDSISSLYNSLNELMSSGTKKEADACIDNITPKYFRKNAYVLYSSTMPYREYDTLSVPQYLKHFKDSYMSTKGKPIIFGDLNILNARKIKGYYDITVSISEKCACSFKRGDQVIENPERSMYIHFYYNNNRLSITNMALK